MPWHLPGQPLRTSVLVAGGAGFALVVAIAIAARAWLPLGAAYPVRAAVVFAAIAAVVGAGVGDHHHYERFGPANQVTLVRALLVALLAGLVGEPAHAGIAAAATGTAAVVTALDGADGWLARRSRMASAFGARFDMEIDALFVLVLSVLVWRHGTAGAWVLVGGLLRYAFVAAGWLLPWMARPLRPTMRAKTITVCHMIGLIVALAPIVPAPIGAIGVAATLAALCWSFAVDIRRLWRAETGAA